MYSIRNRLVLWLTTGFACLIAVVGIYAMMLMREQATKDFDAVLRAKSNALAALTDQENGIIEFDYEPGDMPEFELENEAEYFEFWLQEDNRVLLRSTRLDNGDLPTIEKPSRARVIEDIQLPDGRAGRMIWLTYDAKGPNDSYEHDDEKESTDIDPAIRAPQLVLGVARSREPLDALLSTILMSIILIGSATTLMGVLVAWGAVALSLGPIKSIATQVRGLDAGTLDARIALPRTPRELATIVDQLNSLLDRLDETLQRERRFADNVAHELRTPIAELRSLAIVGAQWPDDEASVARFFCDVKDIAGSMGGIITDLLLLARCQAGIEQVSTSPTSLVHAITMTWSKLAPNASSKGVHYSLDHDEDVILDTDPGKLDIILANLIGNAIDYALPDSEVLIRITNSGSRFNLQITNAADLLSQEDFRHITEPFWRKDDSRATMDHAGLGLSLVNSLATLLTLSVRFKQDPSGTFRVQLDGPILEAGGNKEEPLRHWG